MNLTQRDRYALAAGILSVLLFIAVQWILFPALVEKKSLHAGVASRREALDSICRLAREYRTIKGASQKDLNLLSHRSREFTLFSLLDELAEKSGVKDNVSYMKPDIQPMGSSPYALSRVKIKLEDLALGEFTDFIYSIESSPDKVVIRSLSLTTTGKDLKRLNAVMETQTLIPGGSS